MNVAAMEARAPGSSFSTSANLPTAKLKLVHSGGVEIVDAPGARYFLYRAPGARHVPCSLPLLEQRE
jgi:hypothetical protein